MVAEALAWRRAGPPRSPIRGDELASELGIEPGPELGSLLGEIEAAVFAGEVSTREEALDSGATDPLGQRRIGWRPMASDCLFCGIVAGEVPAQIVDSDEHTVAFMDINPATPGHALVVPRKHSADLIEVSDSDLERDDARRPAAGRAGCATRSSPTASTSSTPAGRPPGRRSSTSTCT